MKRDWNAIRDVLLWVVDEHGGRVVARDTNTDKLAYNNLLLLVEAGMIANESDMADGWLVVDLTPAGRELVDIMRDENVWAEAWKRIHDAGLESVPFTILSELLTDIIHKRLSLPSPGRANGYAR